MTFSLLAVLTFNQTFFKNRYNTLGALSTEYLCHQFSSGNLTSRYQGMFSGYQANIFGVISRRILVENEPGNYSG